MLFVMPPLQLRVESEVPLVAFNFINPPAHTWFPAIGADVTVKVGGGCTDKLIETLAWQPSKVVMYAL